MVVDIEDKLITPSFMLSEFVDSETAVRLGINNAPPPDALRHIVTVLAPGMQSIRELLGCPVLVSSGYRCSQLNTAVNGSKTSAHMRGLAADFRAPRFGRPVDIVRHVLERLPGLMFDQLILEGAGPSAWVHVAFAPPGRAPRHDIRTALFGPGGRTTYVDGIAT